MKEFNYVIKDPVGIHARPAGALGKEVASLAPTKVYVTKGEKKVDAARMISLMSLGVKNGDTVTVTVEGGNEEAAYEQILAFFTNNL